MIKEQIIKLPIYHAQDGLLSVISNNYLKQFDINFNGIKRVFYITDVPDSKIRGNHSHRKTNQILVCINGKCTIFCDDGKQIKEHLLYDQYNALYIPAGIWDSQVYHTRNTTLLVLADNEYDRSDYVENYEEFLKSKS